MVWDDHLTPSPPFRHSLANKHFPPSAPQSQLTTKVGSLGEENQEPPVPHTCVYFPPRACPHSAARARTNFITSRNSASCCASPTNTHLVQSSCPPAFVSPAHPPLISPVNHTPNRADHSHDGPPIGPHTTFIIVKPSRCQLHKSSESLDPQKLRLEHWYHALLPPHRLLVKLHA